MRNRRLPVFQVCHLKKWVRSISSPLEHQSAMETVTNIYVRQILALGNVPLLLFTHQGHKEKWRFVTLVLSEFTPPRTAPQTSASSSVARRGEGPVLSSRPCPLNTYLWKPSNSTPITSVQPYTHTHTQTHLSRAPCILPPLILEESSTGLECGPSSHHVAQLLIRLAIASWGPWNKNEKGHLKAVIPRVETHWEMPRSLRTFLHYNSV